MFLNEKSTFVDFRNFLIFSEAIFEKNAPMKFLCQSYCRCEYYSLRMKVELTFEAYVNHINLEREEQRRAFLQSSGIKSSFASKTLRMSSLQRKLRRSNTGQDFMRVNTIVYSKVPGNSCLEKGAVGNRAPNYGCIKPTGIYN